MLVIACPHALGPRRTARASDLDDARRALGLLVRDRRGLEEARNLTTVVFDKTGTLTLGEHRVVAVRTAGDLSEDEALRLSAAVERDAEHPVARAIVKSAAERGLTVPATEAFQAIPGAACALPWRAGNSRGAVRTCSPASARRPFPNSRVR